jgi:hypothetical protein
MLLNNLFIDSPINFEKKCKTRITASCFLMALGVITIALSFLAGDQIPVLYMAADHYDFIPGFYMGTGFGLFFAAAATIIKNVRYLEKNGKSTKLMRGTVCWDFAAGLTPDIPCCSCSISAS